METEIEQHEEAILSIQDHWIILLRPVSLLIGGAILSFLIHQMALILDPISELLKFMLYLFAYLILLISIHFFFILNFGRLISSITITNKRIIEIKYSPFAFDDINHIALKEITEIEKVKHGLLKNILNYGDVLISISGMEFSVRLRYIQRPSKFVNLIQAVKLGEPLEKIDIRGMGAEVAQKYASILKE